MKRNTFGILVTLLACMPMLHAESFTANSETYTYTVQSTSTPSSGVKHTRLRFSAPNTCNVSIVEVDLTNPDVRVEAFIGQDKMFKTETLTSLYSRKTSAGRKPVVAQNGHFWSMSSQTGTSAGVHATTTCLGGAMVNGSIVTETNWAHDQWNGGPSRTGVLGITSDGKAYVDNYQSQVKVMCPAKWGTDEASNSLLVTDVNKYCIASDFMALFTPEFPSDRVMKVLNTASGQPGTVVTGTATEVYLTMNAGQKLGYNAWVTATVGKIEKNASGGTRGNYDFVLVAAPGVSQNVLASVAVGDQMKIKYNWHIVDNEAAVPAFENLIAGNAIVMKNGALTGRNTDESYNSSAYARSLYGVSADNKKLIMMVVGKGSNDSEGISYGTTTARCATIMKQFGADDVLQVDGGGSAQMLVGGTMVAKSSDSGGVRAVASGIVVYSTSSDEPAEDTDYESAESGYAFAAEWKHKTNHLAAGDARWATAFDGKIYLNDKANSKLYYWNDKGLNDTGISSSGGSAIASDDAGNIILAGTFNKETDVTSFKILKSGATAFSDVTVTLPAGVAAAAMQYMGNAVGNVASSTGGAMFLFPKNATSVAKVVLKNGAQVSSKAIAVTTITSDGQSVALPLSDDVNSDDIAVRMRTDKSFYHSNGSDFVAYANNGITSTAGGTIFEMGGIQYAVEPVGTSYRDGFQIVDLKNNRIVARHAEELTTTAVSPNPNCIIAEVVSQTAANIYQLVPGQLAAKYTFELDSATALDCISVHESENGESSVEYYNLQGMKIVNPTGGIFIKKQGNKVTKVVL